MAKIGQPVPAVDYAGQIWSKKTRYIGVGAMVIGGLWALIRLWKSLMRGIAAGIAAYRSSKDGSDGDIPRTEQDTPMQWVGIVLALSTIPLFFVFHHVTDDWPISAFMAVIMLVAGFLFSAVASYMAGLVGSSNNPISGVTIATLLFSSLLLFMLMGGEWAAGPAAAIMIGAVICCAAAIGGDNMQDLKAGHILGATPRKQQIMQAVGVISAALVMAPILQLLLTSYGIVDPVSPDREALAAPQATLMASVARGVFEQNLPWMMVGIGAAVAVAIIVADLILESREAKFRMPVLAVAVGIYLPIELATPILIGGLLSWAAHARHRRRSATGKVDKPGLAALQSGLLFAAGLITGEALVGILLAIPIAIFEGDNPLQLIDEGLWWPGCILLVVVIAMLGFVAVRRTPQPE
jgi:putative OPT family oligopeptide transporter